MQTEFEILGKIASGGMAEVFAAYARTGTGAERLVAIKQMAPEYANNVDYVDMFLNEGRVIASLNHPNIVQMYDMGIRDGAPYLMMEYLRGFSLQAIQQSKLSRNQPFTLANLIAVGRAVCGGLQHAHDAQDLTGRTLNIVHRDVSPHNIILTGGGELKLIDFGVAQAQWEGHQTRAGVLKGKIRYMAPEQVRARAVDRRTDVYAVGVVLFELATGRSPYVIVDDASDYGCMMAIGEGRIHEMHALRPALPLAFVELVRKAMALEPDDRFVSAEAVATELADIAQQHGLDASLSELTKWVAANMGTAPEPWRGALRMRASGKIAIPTPTLWADPEIATISVAPNDTVDPFAPKTVTLPARIDDDFDGRELAASLANSAILDAIAVTRITASGTAHWMAMLAAVAAMTPPPSLYLARCSLPLLTEIATVAGFAGRARLVSFVAAYHCERCGAESQRVVDVERNRTVLAQRQMPTNRCTACGKDGNANDAEFYADAVQRWLHESLPPAVRDEVDRLQASVSDHAGSLIQKVVLPHETRLLLTRKPTSTVSWPKYLDGIEGSLTFDLQGITLDTNEQASLLAAFANPNGATRIAVERCPPALASQLRSNPRIDVVSLSVSRWCPHCNVARTAVIAVGTLSVAHCSVCAALLQDPQPDPLPAKPKRTRGLLPLAIVSLGAVGGYVAWRATSGQAAPEPMQSVQPLVVGGETTTAVAKPKPLELVVAADGSWSAVGESPGATESALAAAKVEFLTLVAKRIVADAPQQNAACAGDITDAAAVAGRLLDDLGDDIQPVCSAATDPQTAFRLSPAQVRKANAFYQRKFDGWGLGFANALPTHSPGVMVISSNNEGEIPLCTTVTQVSGIVIINLFDLAHQGAAKVELGLASKDRQWTVKVPMP